MARSVRANLGYLLGYSALEHGASLLPDGAEHLNGCDGDQMSPSFKCDFCLNFVVSPVLQPALSYPNSVIFAPNYSVPGPTT